MLKGAPVSAGIGIGKAVILRQDDIVVTRRHITDKQREKDRFLDAVAQFIKEVEITSAHVSRNIGEEEAGIIGVQAAIVQDPELVREVFEIIDTKSVGAEYAFDAVCEKYIKLFDALEDELLSARSADFRDIKMRLLSILMGITGPGLQQVPENSVLVAEDISPSQAALLDRKRVSAIVTQMGTRFSHIAIIARALRIPTVVAVENAISLFRDGDNMIVDGEKGHVIHNPDPERLSYYQKRREEAREYFAQLRSFRDKQTLTADGKRVMLLANLTMSKELCAIAENRVDGIGLFRTEFLYMDTVTLPTEEEQIASYRRVLQAMGGKRVVIRTLDVGGDKPIAHLPQEEEENPNLGMRGIRFCMTHPQVFKTQISALLQAGVYGNMRILLPMISTIEELRWARQMIREVEEELTLRGVPFQHGVRVGIMIETPSAALCAPALAREADFFSLGTNDLTQYTLAVDRSNEVVAHLYSPLHPAVLKLIHAAIDGAHRAGIRIEACGEIPSELRLVPILVGMGVDAMSISASQVLQVRRCISHVDYSEWKAHIPNILELATPDDVKDYMAKAGCNL